MSKRLMTNVLLKFSKFAGFFVNFIIGWRKLFKTFFKTNRSNVEWNWRKPSSIFLLGNFSDNLHLSWENYFGSSSRNKTFSSKNPTERLASGDANCVSTIVLITLLNISSHKIKLLFLNRNSANSKINSLLNLIGIRFLYFAYSLPNITSSCKRQTRKDTNFIMKK